MLSHKAVLTQFPQSKDPVQCLKPRTGRPDHTTRDRRLAIVIYNDSSSKMYVRLGGDEPPTDPEEFTVEIKGREWFHDRWLWNGCVWLWFKSNGGGSAKVTELLP